MLTEQTLTDLNILEVDTLSFDISNLSYYKESFLELKHKGIIKDTNEFFDKDWISIYGGIEYSLHLPNELLLKRIGNKLSIDYKEIDVAWRSFLIRNAHTSKIDAVNQKLKYFFTYESKNMDGKFIINGLEFIEYVKVSQNVLDNMDIPVKEIQRYEKNSRTLPNFDSIFKFIDIVDNIIDNKIEEYFDFIPVFLWWKISSILPLRPTEFTKIKFSSTYQIEDEYYLKFVRTNAKGSMIVKNISLEENYYREETVTISKDTFYLIENIKSLIQKHNYNSNDYLISHSFKNNSLVSKSQRFLNKEVYIVSDLYYCIDRFFTVIEKDYHLNVISRFVKSEDDDIIEKLTPYDSRHIAIINLVLMGVQPETVMELAGHDNINTTQGYYDHTENYIKCYSVAYAKKIRKSLNLNNPQVNRPLINNGMKALNIALNLTKTPVDNGYCIYANIYEDKSNCFLYEGKHSICPYFISDNSFQLEEEINSLELSMFTEVKVLKDLIRDKEKTANFYEKYSITTSNIKQGINNLSMIKSKVDDNNGK